ncbi:MAG: carbohydrate ABC transporter substrate-binding protein [Spirochaetes bacterium]|nr:carbohydrate ABC transporter substrate-binding protein [Spirochaetota bacterium]
MKTFFFFLLIGLIIFSQAMVYQGQRETAGVPTLYWVTDPNPARHEQIALFRAWLKKNKYPDIQVKLDVANRGLQKTIVQGVAGDIIDAGGTQVPVLQAMGLLEEVGPRLASFGLPVFQSYEAIRHELVLDGKAYGTPCNVTPALYIVNQGLFERFGLPPPPRRWSFEEFESRGKRFVAKANEGRKHREIFFAYRVDSVVLRRSLGLGVYNETLTGPWPDLPAVARVLKRVYQWTYVDHLIPSEAELSSMATEQGYGSADYQLFHKGFFAMTWGGRHALIQLRQMAPALHLSGVEMPNGGYPNTLTSSRSLVLYAGSRQKEWAKYFFAFLRSEDYSLHVVQDADSMPPLPAVLDRKAFLEPAAFTNEWPLHKAYAQAARELAIGYEISPFLPPTVNSLKMKAGALFMNGVITAEEAVRQAAEGVNEEIEKYVGRTPERKRQFEKAKALQVKIDALKANGEKIPAEWIANNFLRKYYLDTGKAYWRTAGKTME